MPVYEFRCKTCQRDFEELCRMGQSVDSCPFCGSPQVQKKVSAFIANSAGTSGGSASHSCGNCHGGHCDSCH